MKTEKNSDYYELFRDAEGEVEIALHGAESAPAEQHFHYCIEFLYVLDGEIYATVSGKDFTVRKGQVLLISSCEPHRIIFSPAQRHYILMLPHPYFADYSAVMAKRSFALKCMEDDENQTILTLFRLFYDAVYKKGVF